MHGMSKKTRTYLLSILTAMAVVMSFATFQFIFVVPEFSLNIVDPEFKTVD